MKQSHILSKKFFFHAYRALAAVFSFVVMCGLGFALYLSTELPDRYYLAKGDHFSIGDNQLIQTAGSSRSYPLSVYSSAGNTFQMKLRLLGLIDIKLTATLGTQLSSDELSDVNDDLIDGGASAPAAEGYHIGLDIEVSALGETESQSVDESGLIAVRVGNGWYLWGEGLAL